MLMRDRLFKALMGSIMAVTLAFAIAGCGSQSESEKDFSPTETTTETTTEAPAPYDIASNLTFEDGQTADGETAAVLDTDHFTLTLASADDWSYKINNETSITIYDIAARDAGVGGRLATIIAYDKDDKSYEQLPSFTVAGESGDKVYIVEYPSDVQFDPQNKTYLPMYDQLQKIRDGAADSPLVLK